MDSGEVNKVRHGERMIEGSLEAPLAMMSIRHHHMAGSEEMTIPLSTEMVRSEDRVDGLDCTREEVCITQPTRNSTFYCFDTSTTSRRTGVLFEVSIRR